MNVAPLISKTVTSPVLSKEIGVIVHHPSDRAVILHGSLLTLSKTHQEVSNASANAPKKRAGAGRRIVDFEGGGTCPSHIMGDCPVSKGASTFSRVTVSFSDAKRSKASNHSCFFSYMPLDTMQDVARSSGTANCWSTGLNRKRTQRQRLLGFMVYPHLQSLSNGQIEAFFFRQYKSSPLSRHCFRMLGFLTSG